MSHREHYDWHYLNLHASRNADLRDEITLGEDGDTWTLAGATVAMSWTNRIEEEEVGFFSTANGKIEIVDAANRVIRLAIPLADIAETEPIPGGVLDYDLVVVHPDGSTRRRLVGVVTVDRGVQGRLASASIFAPVPDRLNMLMPMHRGSSVGVVWDNMDVADHVDQWTVYNTAFDGGANADSLTISTQTTAPDGTETARKIIERATNSGHFLTASFCQGGTMTAGSAASAAGYWLRLSVFAKAAERTRIVIGLGSANTNVAGTVNSASGNGTRTLFDLAGGQIISTTTWGTGGAAGDAGKPWIAETPTIVPYFNGWYRCTIGVRVGGVINDTPGTMVFSHFCIDSGVGSAAESNSYVGDTSKGVYVWRGNCMPSAAWGLTSELFSDDFNDATMANIDLGDTLAPGFDWYIHNQWPNPGFQAGAGVTPTPAGYFSVAASELKILKSDLTPLNLMSACTDGGPGFPGGGPGHVGNAFKPPLMMESRVRWPYDTPSPDGTMAFWATSIERLNETGAGGGPNIEADIFEVPAGTGGIQWIVRSTVLGSVGTITVKNAHLGYTKWKPVYEYNTSHNSRVMHNGVLYHVILTNTNQEPPNATYWEVVDPTTLFLNGAPIEAKTLAYDFSEKHTYSWMYLPETLDNDGGMQLLYFTDGRLVLHCTNRDGGLFTGMEVADNNSWPVMFGCGTNRSLYIDWVKVFGKE